MRYALLPTLLVTLAIVAIPSLALADDTKPPALATTQVKPAEPQAADPAPTVKPSVETFVDRNGDGIQDGKEDRFRRKHHGKRGQAGEDGSGLKRQYRHRNGKGGNSGS